MRGLYTICIASPTLHSRWPLVVGLYRGKPTGGTLIVAAVARAVCFRCSGKFVAPENYSHTQQYRLGLRLRIRLNLGLELGLGVGLRLGLGLGLGLRLGLGLALALALVTL